MGPQGLSRAALEYALDKDVQHGGKRHREGCDDHSLVWKNRGRKDVDQADRGVGSRIRENEVQWYTFISCSGSFSI